MRKRFSFIHRVVSHEAKTVERSGKSRKQRPGLWNENVSMNRNLEPQAEKDLKLARVKILREIKRQSVRIFISYMVERPLRYMFFISGNGKSEQSGC